MVCLAVAAAVPAPAATLLDELAALTETNPQISAAEGVVSRATIAIDEAFAEFLPTVTFTGDVGYESTDDPSRRTAGLNTFNSVREKATVTVAQNLFDGSLKAANHRIARLNNTIATTNLDGTVQKVLFEGASAYLNILRAHRLVALAGENESTIREQLQLEDERVRRGSGIEVDVLLAKTRLQIAKEQRVAFEGTVRDAVARYVQVFGHGPAVGSMTNAAAPTAFLPEALDTAVTAGMAENPTILSSIRLVDVSDEEKKAAKSEFLPRLDIVGTANWEDDVEGIPGIQRDYSVGVQASWELFSGFATRSRVGQVVAQRSERLSNLDFARRRVAEDIRLAWNSLQTARERVELLRNAVNIANEVFVARNRLREAGRDTAINVLDAKTEVFNAEIALVTADYDARISVYRLLLAIGRLTPVTLGIATVEDHGEAVDSASTDQ